MTDEVIQVENSSNIESYSYSPTRGVLTVEFKNGVKWEYEQVPDQVFTDMKAAESKGQFVQNQLKPFYHGRRVD